jgi:glucose/arabinose dehydrogenase
MDKSWLIVLIMALLISSLIFYGCASSSATTATSSFTVTAVSTPSTTSANAPPAPTSAQGTIPAGSIQVERVFPNMSFQNMTNLVQPAAKSGLIFVTEQRGVIYAVAADHPEQALSVFLDITDRVHSGGEEGLLGLAFDPNYPDNGHFYVYYSAASPRRSVVARFSLDPANPAVASPQSELIVMEIAQPYANHNGGQIVFGPDGYLYIGLGDGGSEGDPQRNGQNLGTLLGKILRIDVKDLSAAGNYKIPADNPFVNTAGARPEIWAYGLRNPWRFSFDKPTGLLWVGDVGQNHWEEIDVVTKGANYGWNVMEGFHCYSPASGCDQTGLTLPLFEYDHSQGCAVTGGYVYRGNKMPSLQGYYIYGDYCSGNIWALGYRDNTVTGNQLLVKSGLSITSFGEDLSGNLYILSSQGGIYTLIQK